MQPNAQTFDVVVAGLGPVGALTANLCGHAGLRTLVVERGVEPYDLPRAIHFDAEAMRIFQSVGLAEEIAAVTRPLGGSVYLGCDGRPIRRFQAHDTRALLGWPASNLFYQPQLEQILRRGLERFPHVEVRLGHEVLGVRSGEGQAGVRLRGPDGAETEAEARFVLACDGASSPVRKALGIPLDDMGFEERWLVIDAFVDGPMRWPGDLEIPEEVRDGRCSLMLCDPARPATLIPGSGRHRRWEYMLLPHETDAEMLEAARIRSLLARWIAPDDVQVVRAAVYRFHGLVARQWRRGPVFLLGDAAHQTPPFFGQGMCHGLRDAAQLVWKLRLVTDGLADEALLDTYQAERDEHVRTIISASLAAGAAVCILDPEKARTRDAEFRAQEAARAGKTVAMTDVVPPIRGGVLAPGAIGARTPQPQVRQAGRRALLDDLLGGRFTLISLDPPPLAPADLAAWTALDGQTLALAGPGAVEDVTGGVGAWLAELGAHSALVRPDRHLFGLASSAGEVPELLRQLFAQLRPAAPAARPPLAETIP